MTYYFDRPIDTDLVVLWKSTRSKEIATFDLEEAIQLQRSLAEAIKQLKAFLAREAAKESDDRSS